MSSRFPHLTMWRSLLMPKRGAQPPRSINNHSLAFSQDFCRSTRKCIGICSGCPGRYCEECRAPRDQHTSGRETSPQDISPDCTFFGV